MTSNAVSAQGTVLKRGDGGSPEVFTAIAEINDFQGPGGSAAVIDVTTLSSTAKEKRAGLQDEGQFTFNINFVPDDAQHIALRSDKAAGVVRNFKLEFSSGEIATFSALVLAVVISGGVDNVYKAAVTLEITGSVTIA